MFGQQVEANPGDYVVYESSDIGRVGSRGKAVIDKFVNINDELWWMGIGTSGLSTGGPIKQLVEVRKKK